MTEKETSLILEKIKKIATGIVAIFAGIGLFFSAKFFKQKKQGLEKKEDLKKEVKKIEETPANTIVNSATNADELSNRKQELKNEYRAESDAILEAFFRG